MSRRDGNVDKAWSDQYSKPRVADKTVTFWCCDEHGCIRIDLCSSFVDVAFLAMGPTYNDDDVSSVYVSFC